MSQTPRIVFSELGQRWYIATRYREKSGVNAVTGENMRYIVATTKHDVTDQMQTILTSRIGQRKQRKAVKRPRLTCFALETPSLPTSGSATPTAARRSPPA